jgi:hypothetical protein
VFWKSFEYPRTWQKLPNPISHIDSFMMSDCLRLAMMIPFILNRFLKPSHFRKPELNAFQQRTKVSRGDLAAKLWVKCWVLMAKTTTIAFKRYFTEDDYINLRECLDNERNLFLQVQCISSSALLILHCLLIYVLFINNNYKKRRLKILRIFRIYTLIII